MRFLHLSSQYSLCTVSIVVTGASESTVVFIRFHTFQRQLCCTVTGKAAAAVLAQDRVAPSGLEALRRLVCRWILSVEESAEPFCEKSWFQIGVNCKIFPQDSSSGRNWFADTKGADRAEQRQQPLDEDIKTTALEALVPSELEQHLAMNRARLTTY